MTRQLTRIPEDIVRQEVGEIEQEIATANERVGWRDCLHYGACLYELEREPEVIRTAFRRAVELGIIAYERAKDPPGPAHRTPFDFSQLLGIVTSFGSVSERQRIGAIHRRAFLWPEDPFYAVVADTCQVFQSYLRGDPDLDEASRVSELSRAENADREVVEYWAPLAHALLALENRDAVALTKDIVTMTRHHEHLARRGDLQFNPKGMIAVLPLGLVRLARDAGLTCQIDSPYVPFDLL